MVEQCERLNKLAILLFAVILIGCGLVSARANDRYCSLCENHIGCRNNGSFGLKCSHDRVMIRMTSCQQKFILMLHNQLRNKLALGKIPGYMPAQRMPVFQWSTELAYLAELNARRCEYGHDDCRATAEFPYAGQNIARRGNTRDYEKVPEAVERMTNAWFGEYVDADMSYIDAYRHHDEGKQLGHFTVMANERNHRLGCAISRYEQNGYKDNYFVCNYSYTNIRNETVYTPGEAASGCKMGKHPIYRGLCSSKEQIKALPGRAGKH